MKVAVNTRFLLSGKLEGLGWYTHEILQRMVKNHPEVEFLFVFDRQYDPKYVYGSNVQPVVLYPSARHPLLWWVWFEWRLPALLKGWKPDVFFSPDSYCSLRADAPTLMTCHDVVPLRHPEQVPWLVGRYYLHFIPRFLKRADKVITISEHNRAEIVEYGGLSKEQVQVVYNACRDGFKPLTLSEKMAAQQKYALGKAYFLYSGAIHPRKNIVTLLKAYEIFRNNKGADVKLILAGRLAWQTEEIIEAHNHSSYKSDIIFLGYVPDDDLYALMGGALALTYMSLYEGFGLPLLEAMQSDVAVITSNTTALSEVAGDAALTVNPLDAEAIATAMGLVYTDTELRERLIEKGRRRNLEFSWDLASEQIFAALCQAASTKSQ